MKQNKLQHFLPKHPVIASIFMTMLLSFILCAVYVLFITSDATNFAELQEELFLLLLLTPVIAATVIYPFVLTIIQFILLFAHRTFEERYQKFRIFDLLSIILGIFYTPLLLLFSNIVLEADWQEQLYNNQKHTPIYSGAVLTIIAIVIIGIIGYLIVNFLPLRKTPPLITVLGISGMYLGTTLSFIWGFHISDGYWSNIFFLLLPINCLLITIRTILYKVNEWNTTPHETTKIHKIPLLNVCNQLLNRSSNWPFLAFILMWPLLGILIAILILFGQAPDAVIRAWTETSDWNLSQKVSPQNIYYDEHYLCTVAAGGHEKIVKPLRLGIRHGHPVIVNRQLCIANAFEQILEEKTPRFHKAVRGFYDKYGFPVAKLIRSKYIADIIYILMKPLECFFLVVLYLVDVNPENRISIQYTGKHGICK